MSEALRLAEALAQGARQAEEMTAMAGNHSHAGIDHSAIAEYHRLGQVFSNAAEHLRKQDEIVSEALTTTPVEPPHSRACGVRQHAHGSACHGNCPSCAGRPLPWTKP